MFSWCGFCSNIPLPGQYAYEAYKKIQKKFSNKQSTHRQIKLLQKDNSGLVNNISQVSVIGKESNLQDFVNQNRGMVIKKTMKSNYMQLLKKHQQSKQKFTDPDFPPNTISIGNVQDLKGQASWKRISQTIKNPQFISNIIQPADIFQGKLADCYFLSSIAALAEKDYRIKNLFPSLTINPYGIYMARVLFRGILTQVVVDDFIPVNSQGTPLFAQAAGGHQIWVMILEKCWAKLHGSYAAIQYGLPNQVLQAFSGAPTFFYSIPNNKQQQDLLWKNIVEAWSKQYIVCCGSKNNPMVEKAGLVVGHAYTVMGVYEVPYRMIRVRNPWGQRQWNGRASDSDLQFWYRISPLDKQRLGFTEGNDGTFFMLWQDFINYFFMFDICKIDDHASFLNIDCVFDRKNGEVFQFTTKGGTATLNLCQKTMRGASKIQEQKGYSRTTMIVSQQQQASKGYEYKYIRSSSSSTANHYLELFNLQPGKYVVFAKCDWVMDNPDRATLYIYTTSQVTLNMSKQSDHDHLLYKTFLDHARKNTQKQILSESPFEWICNTFLIRQAGYGYFVVHLDENSKRKIGIQFNQKDYNDKRIVLKKPYKNKGQFKVTVEPGKELILLFRMKATKYPSSITLPTPKIYNLI